MLKRLFKSKEIQTRSSSIQNYFNRFLNLSGTNSSGVAVNQHTAITYPAVWACVRNIAETVSTLPIEIVQKSENGNNLLFNHPLYRVLTSEPNPEMGIFAFKEVVQMHLGIWGNAYIYIERGPLGNVIALWPLTPNNVYPFRGRDGQLLYRTEIEGSATDIPALDIIHIANTGINGLSGLSPIQVFRRSIGLSLAADEFGSQFFSRGSVMRGVIEMDKPLKDEAIERLKKGWAKSYEGLSNAFGTPVLEEGMKFKQISLPPNDAQFLETRKYQVEEIARIYRMPPHMIGHLEKATFSNITDQTLNFAKYTIQPWLSRWESELERKLLTEKEKGKVSLQFNMDELLRGDPKSRSEFYDRALKGGWMSVNDVRRKERLNPVEGGDIYLRPLNMAPLDEVETNQNSKEESPK